MKTATLWRNGVWRFEASVYIGGLSVDITPLSVDNSLLSTDISPLHARLHLTEERARERAFRAAAGPYRQQKASTVAPYAAMAAITGPADTSSFRTGSILRFIPSSE